MALPQKAIEQLSREPARTPGWSGKLLMWSSTLFFVSFATFFGVRFGVLPYLERELGEVNAEIQKFEQQIPLADQEKLITFYSQLRNLQSLLRSQLIASALLPWLEEHTHRNVAFAGLSADVAKGQVSVSGEAKTLNDLAEQLAELQENKDVVEFNFSGASRGDGGRWGFSLTLSLDTKLFAPPGITETTP